MASDADQGTRRSPFARIAAIVCGPLAAALVLLSPAPATLSQQGWWTAAIALWMALWWMTEALPLAVTALLPLVAFPLLGVRGIEQTAPAYAHPLVFLFLGGFLLARAMHVWSLDRRLALSVLRVAGTRPSAVIAALMGVTAFLSMWVSNTATAMVMLPIALSVARVFARHDAGQDATAALLMGIAYAATIGGMGTLVGTPPNALFAAFMADTYGIEVSFARWMLIGVPLVLVLLPVTWLVLTRLRFSVAGAAPPRGENAHEAGALASLPPMSRAEKMVAVLMLLVAVGWITRAPLAGAIPWLNLSDAGIAMTGAMLLFLLPVDLRRGRFLLSWEEAVAIRWDVLILFGGGLALASAIGASDLAGWIGGQLSGLHTLPLFALLLVLGALLVFVGELASNTAMAAVFLPVAAAAALALGEPAITLTLPVALFATLGFMLPVATPPNAVIFGSGHVQMRHMRKAGVILDVVGILVVSVAVVSVGRWVFG